MEGGDLDRLQNVRLEHRGTDWLVRTDAKRRGPVPSRPYRAAAPR